LIPPSSIVLQPKGGKKVKSEHRGGGSGSGYGYGDNNNEYGNGNGTSSSPSRGTVSFEQDYDPDRVVTYARTVSPGRGTVNHTTTSPPNSPNNSPMVAGGVAGGVATTTTTAATTNAAAAQDLNYNNNVNITSTTSTRTVASIDAMSFASTHAKPGPQQQQQDDDDDDDDISEYQGIIQSLSGLQPPSSSSPSPSPSFTNPAKIEETILANDTNEDDDDDDDDDNYDDEGKTTTLRSLDDDLSLSVATSTAFSYVTNATTVQKEQQQQQQQLYQHEEEQQEQDRRQQYQQQHYKEDDNTPFPQEYLNIRSSSTNTLDSNSVYNNSSYSNSYSNSNIANSSSTILYGRGLEERMKLAREPLRVCVSCHRQLETIQEELRLHNSNAMKYNSIDPTNIRRLLNSPLAFTLGHEVRKAAYTLNNLLPMPRKMGMFMDSGGLGGMGVGGGGGGGGGYYSGIGMYSSSGVGDMNNQMECDAKDTCKGIVGNFGNVDGVRIPARLLEQAKGVAVLTCIKGGIGFAGAEIGTGLVVSRLSNDNYWSPPCAIGTASVSVGALVGVQLSDHVFLLMTDRAVDMFVNNNDGSFTLGADIGVAVGPLGRSFEADIGKIDGDLTPIYTYSLSKGFYAGISLDGKVMVTRHRINEKFYGREIDAKSLLNGDVPTPPAAQPLYDALKRCHVYASSSSGGSSAALASRRQQAYTAIQNSNYNMSSRHYP